MGLTLATFNVENLLEPQSDAERAVLAGKLDAIAAMLRACDADVVGLQEIGPPELLNTVVERVAGGYGGAVIGTADARGVRCALLSRVPVAHARVHTAETLAFPVFREGDPPPFGGRIPLRRGVVHARVDAPGLGLVDVLVAHFKSSRPVPPRDAVGNELAVTSARGRAEGALRSVAWRAAEALFVRGLVDDVMAGAPDARVAVVGDLNDVPDSLVLRIVRGDGPDELLDCTSGAPSASRYSTLHDGRPSQIDHVLASSALRARLLDARFLTGSLHARWVVASAAPDMPTVDSDHAPLVVRFG
jgi:endonuclease/exonuclease/phosphatase family metal-dependent hydrolase